MLSIIGIATGTLAGLWIAFQVIDFFMLGGPKVQEPTAAQRDAARAARERQLRRRLFN